MTLSWYGMSSGRLHSERMARETLAEAHVGPVSRADEKCATSRCVSSGVMWASKAADERPTGYRSVVEFLHASKVNNCNMSALSVQCSAASPYSTLIMIDQHNNKRGSAVLLLRHRHCTPSVHCSIAQAGLQYR